MNVLVTGRGCFIGSALCRYLASQRYLVLIDEHGFNVDICSEAALDDRIRQTQPIAWYLDIKRWWKPVRVGIQAAAHPNRLAAVQ